MVDGPVHEPVLLPEVIGFLKSAFVEKAEEEILVADCTLGLGGYSEEILRAFPLARVWGIDRDLRAVEISNARLEGYAPRFKALHGNFGEARKLFCELGALGDFASFDAFVFDLGVSNMQLAEPERGFSFQNDGPLDMRMNPHGGGESAADAVNSLSAEDLAKIFWVYGEERFSRRIARGIEERRKRGDIKTTGELVEIIRSVLPAPVQRKMGGHPARRVFQALRIYVNDELGELESALSSVKEIASTGAVAAVVSYHSLEDRMVKHTFRAWEKEEKLGRVLTRQPVLPEAEETERNYKARSAKLRVFKFV